MATFMSRDETERKQSGYCFKYLSNQIKYFYFWCLLNTKKYDGGKKKKKKQWWNVTEVHLLE